MKAKITWKNIKAFFQGNYRYSLYYGPFKFLLRPHIAEQIDFRIRFMDQECYEQGECKMCGCQTTALQMAHKACSKPCYPELMSKHQWEGFIEGGYLHSDSSGIWEYFPLASYTHITGLPNREMLSLYQRKSKIPGWTATNYYPRA